MPTKKPSEDWIDAIRVSMRDSIGNRKWQLIENKGKARLGIRFENGKRTYKYLPYKWQRTNAKEIQNFIEQVAHLHIKKGIPIDEAFDRTKLSAPKKEELPRAKTEKSLLLNAWEKYRFYKVKQTGEVSESTWRKEYGNMVINKDGTEEPKGKTFTKLIQVTDSQDANSLLINIGKFNVAGSEYRKKRVQIIRSFLEWAISKESGYLLPSASWTPPAKGNIKKYKGKPPASLRKKTEAPIYPITEDQIFELINYLDNPPEEAREDIKARAKEWSFPIKLLALYGLRPIEIFHLSIKNDGKEDYIWCSYVKKSGNGYTKPRRLRPLLGDAEEWQEKWKLIQKIKNKEPLPACSSGAGQGFRDYLKHNPIWKRLREEHENLSSYSFRHAYASRGHKNYLFPEDDMCRFMGHGKEAHAKYAIYFDEQTLEDSYRRGQERRRNFHT